MITSPQIGVARKSPKHILFDLGLREEKGNYTDDQQAHIKNREPVVFGPSVATTLQENGVASTEIDWVVYSHVHWDHTGEPSEFPNASFIIGHGSGALLERGFDASAGSHAAFDKKLLDHRDVFELPPYLEGGNVDDESLVTTNALPPNAWSPLGPFPEAMDMLGDGSVFLIPSPGHLQGHVNLLCRVAEKRWVYLGGDTFHHRSLLTGEAEIATWRDIEGRELCVHTDRAAAEEMFALLRKLQDQAAADGMEVEIISSHDQDWYDANQERLFPQTL
jgi:3-hydroxyisobutyrate dehydrogenase